MITEAFAEALKDIAKPAAVAATPQVAKLFGVTIDAWLLYLALAYAVLRLLAMIPRVYGCGVCFWKHRTCNFSCKNPVVE